MPVITRIPVLLIASLAGVSASYGGLGGIDLRGVVLGSTCEQAIQQELSLSSQPVMSVDEMMNLHLLGFNDLRSPGEPKRVIYKCDDSGHIVSILVKIASRGESDAMKTYAAMKAEFAAKFGPPAVDSDRYNEFQKRLLAGISVSASSQWPELDDQVLSIQVELPDSKGIWNVSISVTRPGRKH